MKTLAFTVLLAMLPGMVGAEEPPIEKVPSRIYCEGADAWPVTIILGDIKQLIASKDKSAVKNANIKAQTVGFKRVGPRPWRSDFGGDEPAPGEVIYQLVQHVRVTSNGGKNYDFLVSADVSNSSCVLSTPLVVQTSPEYKVIGDWETYLQAYQRGVQGEGKMSPNLIGTVFPNPKTSTYSGNSP